MKKIVYSSGEKHGTLTLVKFSHSGKWGTKFWVCRCDCGTEKVFAIYDVYSGHTKSCGCMTSKMKSNAQKKRLNYHGLTETKEYRIWCHMRDRCGRKENPKYKYYGGRGIKVCDRWKKRFINFLADMGKCPNGMSLDRIFVNNDYMPSNCRWASHMTQGSNKRNCKKVILGGTEITRVEAERILGIGYGSINNRKNLYGETLQEATDHFVKKKKIEMTCNDVELWKNMENNYVLAQMGMS